MFWLPLLGGSLTKVFYEIIHLVSVCNPRPEGPSAGILTLFLSTFPYKEIDDGSPHRCVVAVSWWAPICIRWYILMEQEGYRKLLALNSQITWTCIGNFPVLWATFCVFPSAGVAGGRMGLLTPEFWEIRKLESQTGHTAVGTTNQSFVVKREVMAGFLMGFPS